MIQLRTTGGGTGALALSYSVLLGPLKCNYVTSAAAFTYKPTETAEGGNLITISDQPLTVTPVACGSTAKLDGVFSLSIVFGGGNIFLM